MDEAPGTVMEDAQNPTPVQRRLHWRMLLGLLLLGLAGSFAFYYFWIAKPAGTGPAGPAVPADAFQEPWTTRPVLVLGLGDSVTAGFGASPGLSYFERLLANPFAEFDDLRGVNLRAAFPHLRAQNLAVSGSTSPQHLEHQVAPLETQPPDTLGLVFMTTGGNDLIHNYGRTPPRPDAMYGATWDEAQPWIASFAQRLDTMVTQLRAKFPGGCHIFLANIYDPTDGLADPEGVGLPPWKDSTRILNAYNDALKECAERHEHVFLVDIHSPFLGHGIHCTQFWTPHYRASDPHFWYNPNLEDPNDRGYDALRRLFLLALLGEKAALTDASE